MIYNVRSPEDVIFAEEWRNYPVTLVAEHNATHGFVAGRLTRELLQSVPDLASRTVMTCGPAPIWRRSSRMLPPWASPASLREKFFTPVAEAATSGLKFTKLQPAREFYAPVGTTLLDALESNKVPVAACPPRRRLRLLQNQSGFREVQRHQHHDADRRRNRRRLCAGLLLSSAERSGSRLRSKSPVALPLTGGYIAVRFGSPEKARAASGKSPATINKRSGDMR